MQFPIVTMSLCTSLYLLLFVYNLNNACQARKFRLNAVGRTTQLKRLKLIIKVNIVQTVQPIQVYFQD